jgi:hypothetical protein
MKFSIHKKFLINNLSKKQFFTSNINVPKTMKSVLQTNVGGAETLFIGESQTPVNRK